MDVCNDVGGDFSGNYYDGKCLAGSSSQTISETGSTSSGNSVTDTETVQETPQTENITPEKEVPAENIETYTLENDFATCGIIHDIQDSGYSYPQTGIFEDIANSPEQDIIRKFATIGIVNGYQDGTF